MKRIIICCDGTWNTRDQKVPTNVSKIAGVISPVDALGSPQIVHYLDGVGTRTWVDRLPGGIFGKGLWQNVQDAYARLVKDYEPGDQVFIFGFSRGAYTARSLAGLIRKCGVLSPENSDRIDEAYNFYRDRTVKPTAERAIEFRRDYSVAIPEQFQPAPDIPFFDPNEPQYTDVSIDRPREFENVPRIHFVGVWDAVGALGIPLGWLGNLFNSRHKFHDVSLSRMVDHAYHAVGIDEKRKPFSPTLWERHPTASKQVMEQRWFAGVHGDVGGGSVDARRSDRALLWMMGKARDCGLQFDIEKVRRFHNVLDGRISSSLFHEVMDRLPFDVGIYKRPIGEGVPWDRANYLGGLSEETVDPAVVDLNLADPDYMPANLVGYFRARPGLLAAMQPGEMTRRVW